MSAINQKEYLKKYLGIGKNPGDKKKRKKKEKVVNKSVKIIDDDDYGFTQEVQEDLNAENEDAPQIVAVIDERPVSLQVDDQNNKLWKPIGEVSTTEPEKTGFNFKLGQKKESSKSRKDLSRYESLPSKKHGKNDEDESPPRRRRVSEDKSPPRKIKVEPDSDESPPRRRNDDNSPPRKSRRFSEDKSPPRRIKQEKYDDNSPNRRSNEDMSPPRRRNDDNSPPRRRKNEEDMSPPRQRRNKDSSPPHRARNEDNSLSRRKKNEDNSPPRRKNEDNSPPRRRKNEDNSPLRKKRTEDNSPPRKIKTEDNSPPRRSRNTDNSPPRRKTSKEDKKSRWGVWPADSSPPREDADKKMKKTLDGKKAGLQNAKDLVKETQALKQREEEIFKNMSAEVSGQNAQTVVRNKKVVDPEEEALKARKERENKEKYSKWGKGLKQVEDRNDRLAEELHEMSKPLARYADDEDLEKYLKDQERDGDPMLAYIRKKRRKEAVESGVPEKPQYMGEFMPNRFGIRPGYRWDGVDRSNGYEKKWFTVQNSKKAALEESYKWSTEDM